MTYCVALKLDAGLVFASDSRTNAGVDQIACFKKMRTFVRAGERVVIIVSSGNLSITQNAINVLEHRSRRQEGHTLWTAESMFDIAMLLGDCLRDVRERDEPFLSEKNIASGSNFIIGGQVSGEPPRLFLMYDEGNFIEATEETPFFQIGETKYGKPIIDRVIHAKTPLMDAIKCVLVSFDSTMRSNVAVGLPIDLACYRHDSCVLDRVQHITETDSYFSLISQRWSEGLRGVFASLPDPAWDATSGLKRMPNSK